MTEEAGNSETSVHMYRITRCRLTQGTIQTQPLHDKSNTSCQFISYATHSQYLKLLIIAIFTAGKFRILTLLLIILYSTSERVTTGLQTCNIKHFKRPCLQGKYLLTADAGIQSQGSSGVIRGTKYDAGAGFSPRTSIFSCQYHSTIVPN
jgi:hypothetical protein